MDVYQGSFYVRNIMVQQGPLALPPEQRSYATPSFRIIDYGRGQCWDWELEEKDKGNGKDKGKGKGKKDLKRDRADFVQSIVDEVARARRELLVDEMGF